MVEKDINKRWEQGIEHHPNTVELFEALRKIDYEYGSDMFDWKCGGDGDNGEELMYHLDIYFECKEAGEEI